MQKKISSGKSTPRVPSPGGFMLTARDTRYFLKNYFTYSNASNYHRSNVLDYLNISWDILQCEDCMVQRYFHDFK